jgi:hypothetical protein
MIPRKKVTIECPDGSVHRNVDALVEEMVDGAVVVIADLPMPGIDFGAVESFPYYITVSDGSRASFILRANSAGSTKYEFISSG